MKFEEIKSKLKKIEIKTLRKKIGFFIIGDKVDINGKVIRVYYYPYSFDNLRDLRKFLKKFEDFLNCEIYSSELDHFFWTYKNDNKKIIYKSKDKTFYRFLSAGSLNSAHLTVWSADKAFEKYDFSLNNVGNLILVEFYKIEDCFEADISNYTNYNFKTIQTY